MGIVVTGNGYITTQVLREILAALDDALKPEDLDGIIAEIDTDGSGTVDFDGKSSLFPVLRVNCYGELNVIYKTAD